MKIGKPAEIQQTDALSRPAQAGASATSSGHTASGAVERATAVDAVRLSQTSRDLAAESGGGSTPVRTAKVEAVRTAIREGHFQVNAHAVAEKMITQAAELLETLSNKR